MFVKATRKGGEIEVREKGQCEGRSNVVQYHLDWSYKKERRLDKESIVNFCRNFLVSEKMASLKPLPDEVWKLVETDLQRHYGTESELGQNRHIERLGEGQVR